MIYLESDIVCWPFWFNLFDHLQRSIVDLIDVNRDIQPYRCIILLTVQLLTVHPVSNSKAITHVRGAVEILSPPDVYTKEGNDFSLNECKQCFVGVCLFSMIIVMCSVRLTLKEITDENLCEGKHKKH